MLQTIIQKLGNQQPTDGHRVKKVGWTLHGSCADDQRRSQEFVKGGL